MPMMLAMLVLNLRMDGCNRVTAVTATVMIMNIQSYCSKQTRECAPQVLCLHPAATEVDVNWTKCIKTQRVIMQFEFPALSLHGKRYQNMLPGRYLCVRPAAQSTKNSHPTITTSRSVSITNIRLSAPTHRLNLFLGATARHLA